MRFPLYLCLAATAAACDQARPAPPDPPPLPAPRPGADSAALARAVAHAEGLDPLNSLLILHRDSLVIDAYFRGMDPDRPVNVKSVSKTILSPLVGIAIRDSLLGGPDDTLAELFPAYVDSGDSAQQRHVTLHHLLSMTTGMEGTSFRNYGPWVSSRNWVRHALAQPTVCTPGRCMTYSTGNTHLLSVLLSERAGTDLITWGRAVLFDELDIPLRPWDRDPQGHYLGGNNMRFTPRELMRFGRLFLDSGRANGRQLVPWEWIDRSWSVYTRSRWNGHRYGYLWWTRQMNGETVRFAWGYGGQFLFLVPRLDLGVVVTSSLTDRPDDVRHNPRVYDLLACHVIPAFRETGAAGGPCHWRWSAWSDRSPERTSPG